MPHVSVPVPAALQRVCPALHTGVGLHEQLAAPRAHTWPELAQAASPVTAKQPFASCVQTPSWFEPAGSQTGPAALHALTHAQAPGLGLHA